MKTLRVLILSLIVALSGGTIAAQTAPAKTGKAAKGAAAKADTAKSTASTADKAGALIDINRASAAELKALPGIGDAYSAAIIKNRPYANKAQLVSRKVISESLYQKIKDQIIAKQ